MSNHLYATAAQCWRAVITRDPAAIDAFVFAVLTTKIYCRPTCRARPARHSNVRFYDSALEAASAGYRACKRCKPDQRPEISEEKAQETKIQQACEIIDENCGQISVKQLAKEVGMSERYFHDCFKRSTCITPGAYANTVRERCAKSNWTQNENNPHLDSLSCRTFSNPASDSTSSTLCHGPDTANTLQRDIFTADVSDAYWSQQLDGIGDYLTSEEAPWDMLDLDLAWGSGAELCLDPDFELDQCPSIPGVGSAN